MTRDKDSDSHEIQNGIPDIPEPDKTFKKWID